MQKKLVHIHLGRKYQAKAPIEAFRHSATFYFIKGSPYTFLNTHCLNTETLRNGPKEYSPNSFFGILRLYP